MGHLSDSISLLEQAAGTEFESKYARRVLCRAANHMYDNWVTSSDDREAAHILDTLFLQIKVDEITARENHRKTPVKRSL